MLIEVTLLLNLQAYAYNYDIAYRAPNKIYYKRELKYTSIAI